MDMGLSKMDNETIMLVSKDMRMMQKKDMTSYSILHWELKQGVENGVEMLVVFRRKIMSEMMTTYFPSILLMMITYATTFFKPFFFEAALSVNLTTMLVMTTIFISKMEGLPPTSATKMIDYWLILCQLVPFIQVVLLTAKEHIKDEDLQDENQKEFIGRQLPKKENQGIKLEADYHSREVWKKTQTKQSLTILTIIGKF